MHRHGLNRVPLLYALIYSSKPSAKIGISEEFPKIIGNYLTKEKGI
jgi:hypothetical protein